MHLTACTLYYRAARHLHHLMDTDSMLCVIIVCARPSLHHVQALHSLIDADSVLSVIIGRSRCSLQMRHYLANADCMLCVIKVCAKELQKAEQTHS